jgi:ElaB/YqjD/DUF883 family membrane-anchored ribosome-binding protein
VNPESGSKKGYKKMTQSRFEQTSEQIADTIHKASRAASSAAETIEDGVGAAQRAVKQGSYAAVDALDEARRRVQRNPVEMVLASLAVGIATGAAISWMMKRKPSCNCSEMCGRD